MFRRAGSVFAATLFVIIGLDQASKAFIRSSMSVGLSISVLPDVFSITHVSNRGAAFGLFQGHTGFFLVISVLVLLGIAIAWWYYRPRQRWVVVSLGLIASGAVGNLIDRVVAGRVTDFFEIHGWPVFNVADMALDVGVAILIAWMLFAPQDDSRDDPTGADAPTLSDMPVEMPEARDERTDIG